MDVHNGDVLSIVSLPDFNLNEEEKYKRFKLYK